MASNMDTVGTFEMAKALSKVYYLYFLFYFCEVELGKIYILDSQ